MMVEITRLMNLEKEAKKKRKIVGTRQNPGETPHLETDVVDPNTIVPSHWIVVSHFRSPTQLEPVVDQT